MGSREGYQFSLKEQMRIRRDDKLLHEYLTDRKLNETSLRQILDLGAPVNAQNDNGMTPLHCALSEKNNCELPIIRLLVERGADVRGKDHGRRSSSHHAADNKNISVEILEFLSESGANFCTFKKKPNSVLAYALFQSQLSLDVIKWLLEKVADISAANQDGVTILHFAAQWNRKDVIELILKKQNIDVNLPDSSGNTPLHWVFLENSTKFYETRFDVVKILLEAGADVNKKNSSGEQALHKAAASRLFIPSVIKLLLDYGANVNESNINGDTPLELAVKNIKSSRAIVKILLDAGAIIFKKLPSIPSANNPFYSAIKIYQDQMWGNRCSPQRWKEVRKIVILLLKYSLLERTDTSYHLLPLNKEEKIVILGRLKVFEKQCHQELDKPCPKFQKLAQLFRYCRLGNDLPIQEIITMLFKNCCPIYKEVLEGLLKRKDLEEELKCYPLYEEKNPEERTVLNYDATCNVIQYLTEKDLLSLLLAVYHT